jgi:hypothetical protein
MPVLTILVLLRREANPQNLTGCFEIRARDGWLTNHYNYRVARLWQEDPEPYLTAGVNLVPLVPLTNVSEAARPELVQRIADRINAVPGPRSAMLWTASGRWFSTRRGVPSADRFSGGAVKNFHAIGQLITSPMFAVVLCAVSACAIWFGMLRQPGGARNPSLTGNQRIGQRAGRDTRLGGAGLEGASGTSRAQKSQRALGAVAAKSGLQLENRTGQEKLEIEEFLAENEPVPVSPASAKPDRSQDAARESATPSTRDAIGPRDPRAKALKAYRSKNASVADDVGSQKRMAAWCDEQGLWDAAKAHWEAVLRLDANHNEARRRLGYRFRGGQWVLDEASADEIARKKADAYWERELKKLHTAMRCRSKIAVPGRALALAQVEAVGDPRAAPAIWSVFAADVGHHGTIVAILRRLGTRKASQMLAAMAVYSPDKKARVAAVAALRGRPPADYGQRLVALMHSPLRVEERLVPIAGGSPVRQLFVEGETANYNFLFSRIDAPTSESQVGWIQPRFSAGEIAMARQFNQNQAAMAKQGLDRQVELAKQTIAKYNDSIRSLNERVARVLDEASGAGIRPAPEDGKRWLAAALGTEYQPSSAGPKPTFTEIVAPLYNPTFVPVPVSC